MCAALSRPTLTPNARRDHASPAPGQKHLNVGCRFCALPFSPLTAASYRRFGDNGLKERLVYALLSMRSYSETHPTSRRRHESFHHLKITQEKRHAPGPPVRCPRALEE